MLQQLYGGQSVERVGMVCVCVWWGCRSGGLISDQIIRFAIVSAAAVRGSGRLKPGSGLVNIHEGTGVRARGLDCSSKTLLQLMELKAVLSTKMELYWGGLTSH